MRAAWPLLALLVLAGPVGAQAFTADLPFTDVQGAKSVPVMAGALEVAAQADGSPALMHNVTTFVIDGLDIVCWTYPCRESPGALQVRVVQGSTVAIQFPRAGNLHLAAGHAIATPVGLDGEKAGFGDLAAGLTLAPSLAIATDAGALSFVPQTLAAAADGPVPAQSPVPGLPASAASFFQAADPDDSNGAVLAGLTKGSRIEVLDGGAVVHTVNGYGGLLLQGTVQARGIVAEAYLVPCLAGCDVQVTRSGGSLGVEAAARGLFGLVDLAGGGKVPPINLGPFGSLVDQVADGALMLFPLVARPSDFSVDNLTLVRFDRFAATLRPTEPEASGNGNLVIQSGSVAGAPAFVGATYFAMPLWSYILWGLALVAVVVRLATRAPKTHARWDRFRWVGRVLGILAWAALAFVWHVAFGRVLGLSATSDGLDATARAVIGTVELVTLLAMVLMVVLPARILLGNLFRIVRQGRFMGLAGPLATGCGILLGAPLLLGLVDFALRFAP